MTHTVIRQAWIESESGWGIRPDGYSLHLSLADRDAFIKDYWDRMPEEVPNEYSRPNGEPSQTIIDDVTYAKIRASKNGIRLI